jgi:hypothetical protein
MACTNLIPQSEAKGSSSRAGSGKETPDRWRRWRRMVDGSPSHPRNTNWNSIRLVKWDWDDNDDNSNNDNNKNCEIVLILL